ncbi:hypothetical protein APHAL10511_001322 [Amanita phalloides]|nr:hypothetical protein APHAL10511_001322 [Amanita phalloides]
MGQRERYSSPEVRAGDAMATKAVLICSTAFVLSSWIIVMINDPLSFGWFAPHPLLQSAALVLFTYGIFTLQPTTQPRTKAAGLVRHQLATIITGVPVIVLGTLSIWYNKALNGKPHFVTWHGTFGLLCITWLVVQAFVGGGSVWFGGYVFGGGMRAKSVWKYHRASGYILFILMIFTAHLGGAWSNWGIKHTNIPVRFLAFTIAPFGIVVSVLARVRLTKMKFS